MAALRLRLSSQRRPDPLALTGIRMTVSIYPSIFFGIVIVCLLFYKIDKQLNLRIADELAERRKSFGSPSPAV